MSTNWILNQSWRLRWTWNSFWTNNINVLQHCMFFCVVFVVYNQGKKVNRDDNCDKDMSYDIWLKPPLPSERSIWGKNNVFYTGACTTSITPTKLAIFENESGHFGTAVWLIDQRSQVVYSHLSTWWKGLGRWIVCSSTENLNEVKKVQVKPHRDTSRL